MVAPQQTVGILGYQGCIEPHEKILSSLGVTTLRVRVPSDLLKIERLIIPGGESTTMLKLLEKYEMLAPLQQFARTSPVWGICAGAILLAQEVQNPAQTSLGAIDIRAHRNFYGSQSDSFTTTLAIKILDHPIESQFIRAPLLIKLPASAGRPDVEELASVGSQGVFFAQGRCWASSFHVELGVDSSLHRKFLSL
jgi:5'-phosphate synthase pdxT subunit